MANRTFRARNLDVKRALDIVRDETLLDSTEGLPAREVATEKAEIDAGNEKVSCRSSSIHLLRFLIWLQQVLNVVFTLAGQDSTP